VTKAYALRQPIPQRRHAGSQHDRLPLLLRISRRRAVESTHYCETPADFRRALDTAIAARRPSLITVMLDPEARRRPQQFAWLTR
jgi:hypothetical protein